MLPNLATSKTFHHHKTSLTVVQHQYLINLMMWQSHQPAVTLVAGMWLVSSVTMTSMWVFTWWHLSESSSSPVGRRRRSFASSNIFKDIESYDKSVSLEEKWNYRQTKNNFKINSSVILFHQLLYYFELCILSVLCFCCVLLCVRLDKWITVQATLFTVGMPCILFITLAVCWIVLCIGFCNNFFYSKMISKPVY